MTIRPSESSARFGSRVEARPIEGFSPWRHRFALLTAGSTLVLIFVGGLVTSTGSSLSVPDWPLSYGQFFPPMVGGVLYEHGHRIVAAAVALATAALAIWTWREEPRAWVRRLAVAALAAVLLQALLGGVTVLLRLPTAVSVSHAALAQAFFCLVSALALVTGPDWLLRPPADDGDRELSSLAAITTAAIYLQLLLGAVMRHTGSGLAIPDFPLAFGALVPPITSFGVGIHFAHRVGATIVGGLVLATAAWVFVAHRDDRRRLRGAALMIALLALQIALGATIIWTRKAVTPTTAHVAIGAALLVTSLVLTLRSRRRAAAVDWPPEAIARRAPA